MAWVAAIVIVGLVATLTGVGCVVVITIDVAEGTFVFDGLVCAREWVYDVVVEGSGYPGSFGVARFAIGRELCGGMVGVGGTIKIVLVTTDTGVRCIVVIAIVTSGTFIGDGSMRSIERVEVIVNIESSGVPSGFCAMAGSAIIG